MKKFKIDKQRRLILSKSFFSVRKFPLSSIRKISVQRVLSLFDEICFVVDLNSGKTGFIRETQSNFEWLAQEFNLDDLFGPRWREKAELGQRFEANFKS